MFGEMSKTQNDDKIYINETINSKYNILDLLYYYYWFVSFMIAGDTLAWTNDEEFCRKVLGGLGLSSRVIEGVHFKTFETCNFFSGVLFLLEACEVTYKPATS